MLVAQTLLSELPNTYAERSCSGKGVHIICKGNLGDNYKKRNDVIGVEMYDTKRFLCVTGDVINDRKSIIDYSYTVKVVNQKYLGVKPKRVEVAKRVATMSDRELIDKIKSSKQGDKFSQLYNGDKSKYPSASNADFAFISLLAFWTQDKNQIDSIVRSSGLYREKWDKRIGDSTYGEITIDNALATCNKSYRRSNYEM